MCMTTGVKPSATPPGGAPGGSTGGTGLCCACPADTNVSRVGQSNYFVAPYANWGDIRNKCHLDLKRTAKKGDITIKKTFNLTYQAGATEAADEATVTSAINKAIGTWSKEAKKYKIRIEQPGCDPQKCSIKFETEIVASGGDVRVRVDKTAAPVAPAPGLRSYVAGGTDMTFYLNGVGAVDWTMVHEIGHCYGLPDEYVYDHPSSTAPKVTFKAATDPSKEVTLLTSSIPASAPGTFAFDNDCVMGRNGNARYPIYLFYWIAIEVQKLMAAEGTAASVYIE